MDKNYFIIHSVKGGCGKSSVSLFTGLLLSMEEKNSIIIDCDLSASATHKLYAPSNGGDENTIQLMDKKIKDNALNEYLRGDVVDIDDIINPIRFNWNIDKNTDIPKNMELDYIFAHSENSKLSDFRFNIGSNRANNMPIGQFNNKFKELLSIIKASKNYKHVIFDLAASSNEYSYIIYKYLLELHNEKNKMFLVLVTTSDRSHLEETTQYLKEVIAGTTEKRRFDKVIVIINSLIIYDKEVNKNNDKENDVYSAFCRNIVQMVKDAKMKDYEFVSFVKLPFQMPYFELTHFPKMIALENLNITDYRETLKKVLEGKIECDNCI